MVGVVSGPRGCASKGEHEHVANLCAVCGQGEWTGKHTADLYGRPMPGCHAYVLGPMPKHDVIGASSICACGKPATDPVHDFDEPAPQEVWTVEASCLTCASEYTARREGADGLFTWLHYHAGHELVFGSEVAS